MIRRRALLTAGVAIAAGAAWPSEPATAQTTRTVVAVPPPTGRPVIFYTPHQDDETLFMGQIIARHALAGREVHVVLVTDGRASTARNAINGLTSNGWWQDHHQPEREGYAPLTQQQLSEARNREFVSACGQLGVWPANIHLEGFRDGTLTLTQATGVLEKYDALFPTAGHYTMSWDDATSDHSILGQALRTLALADRTKWNDVRWTIKPENAHRVPGAKAYTMPRDVLPLAQELARRAARPYAAWCPAAGAFAVGYHSVGPTYFPRVEKGELNWSHGL
ncbi:PIG-L family deacetylase [Jiangella aurantiaca]|uniref:PIG-L family deacetylase n=1 Tax=Jiangella aurantiaca TaxID=2530373 RepID=A0A4V2YSH7_9ACTN|nr:PIG-L family deacetylase [Jiangella aurantiaca]TDD70177.1 PIG-L family deacetylase [Jiangella aurantiaca]